MSDQKHDRPRKGDLLFRGDLPDWQNNACLRGSGVGDPFAFVEGYRRGADILVAHVVENGSDQDLLIYPIIFLYRHHLEIAMKRILRRFPRLLSRARTSNEKKVLKDHKLFDLWQALRPAIDDLCASVGWDKPEKADIQGADDYIRQLHEIDPSSFSFRYTHDKNDETKALLPPDLHRVNLRHFAEMVNRLVRFIDEMDTATSVVADWQDDMESSYGN